MNSIYDVPITNSLGQRVTLEEYKGKVLLIVNTASRCGATPQLKDLQELYIQYQEKGFEVLAFPCNQFLKQEPLEDVDITKTYCDLYDTTFPIFAKINVNGKNKAPLYKYLQSNQDPSFGSPRIKWNFTKFLISRGGDIVNRYGTQIKPKEIKPDIQKLLLQ